MQAPSLKIESVPLASIRLDPQNARAHNARNLATIKNSLQRFGQQKPIVITAEGMVIAGNGTLLAAQALGWKSIAVVRTRLTGAAARGYALVDNRSGELASWDSDRLLEQLGSLPPELARLLDFTDEEKAMLNSPINLPGEPGTDGNAEPGSNTGALSESFGVSPFSVLDARQGWWQRRKQSWIALGIQSELGRQSNALDYSEAAQRFGYGKRGLCFKGIASLNAIAARNVRPGGGSGKNTVWMGSNSKPIDETGLSGTSIFDPVLCELCIRWFCPPGGTVLDPFAGGSVRGIVGARLLREYTGVDLRAEQIEANRHQAEAICRKGIKPRWICGDSMEIARLAKDVKADIVFTCPPYADLERYSDDPRDLSVMDYPAFIEAFGKIMAASCALLKPDRFAVVVVSEVRGPDGTYRGFVPDTVRLMQAAGLSYYNEAILITMIGSLPLRVRKQFETSRKLGRTHQTVLVFCKGNPRRATAACGPCEYGSLEDTPLPGEPGGTEG